MFAYPLIHLLLHHLLLLLLCSCSSCSCSCSSCSCCCSSCSSSSLPPFLSHYHSPVTGTCIHALSCHMLCSPRPALASCATTLLFVPLRLPLHHRYCSILHSRALTTRCFGPWQLWELASGRLWFRCWDNSSVSRSVAICAICMVGGGRHQGMMGWPT